MSDEAGEEGSFVQRADSFLAGMSEFRGPRFFHALHVVNVAPARFGCGVALDLDP